MMMMMMDSTMMMMMMMISGVDQEPPENNPEVEKLGMVEKLGQGEGHEHEMIEDAMDEATKARFDLSGRGR